MTCRHQCGISSHADGLRQAYHKSEHLNRSIRARVMSYCQDSDCRRTCPSVRRPRRIAGRARVMPWTSHHDSPRAILLWLLLLSVPSGPNSIGWASAEEGSNHPDWIPLDRMGSGMFRSSEILQMYHIQVRCVFIYVETIRTSRSIENTCVMDWFDLIQARLRPIKHPSTSIVWCYTNSGDHDIFATAKEAGRGRYFPPRLKSHLVFC